jgi:ProP effector
MGKNRFHQVDVTLAFLFNRYPKCFVRREIKRRPLKIGIRLDLAAAGLEPGPLGLALKVYCANSGYLRAMHEGAPRIDLDGLPAGVVTAEDAAHAARVLEDYRARQMAPAKVVEVKTKVELKPKPAPKHDGLADLRAAAMARKTRAA